NWSYKKCFVWIRKYIDFLKFSSPAVLVSTLSAQAPIFLLNAFFGAHSAGLYSMIQRVMLAPVGLIASAVNRVYMQRVAELKYKKNEIWPFTMNLIRYTTLVGLMAIPLAYVVFDLGILALFFGDKWSALDQYAAVMLPLVFFALVSSAVAGFAVLGKNKLGLIYQLFLLIVICSAVVLTKVFSGAEISVYMAISLALSSVYICQIVSIILATKSVDKGNGYV
ncbi:oligosaccharide flippase family protein, partial [Oleiphilus sp. HI0080]